MSQSPTAAPAVRAHENADNVTVVDTESTMQALLDTIDDTDYRAILDATGDDVLSANEISETCDLPVMSLDANFHRLKSELISCTDPVVRNYSRSLVHDRSP